jgi:uncharacterized protein YdeI (YjbR/CyaY-like superfamily)
MKPLFFDSPGDFRAWLKAHHRGTQELWVGFHKKRSGKPSITYVQALDEALCFGWIDGVRKNVNQTSYTIRFTPRKPKSNWSHRNTKRARELKKLGRMMPAGLKAFDERKTSPTYSYETRPAELPRAYLARLKAEAKAWEFLQRQAPWYQRTVTWWVISAKKEKTRERRLQTLIEDSAHGRRIGLVPRLKGKRSTAS